MTKIPPTEVQERLSKYLNRCPKNAEVKRYLGGGTDGDVWETTRATAIKALRYPRGYANERDSYLRLADFGMTDRLGGFWVPRMVGFDDELQIVEMEMMHSPPYVIDFAKVKLNTPPDYSDDVLAQAEIDGQEQFEHHWPEVKLLLSDLESLLIYYLDPKRGNIAFADLT